MEHHFNIDVAKDLGIEEAIVLHSIFFWLSKNASNNKHFYDGLYWFYNSKKAFVELFPYMNETKIFRVLKNLEEKFIIAKGNYSKDKWDKTNWYALTKNGIDYMVRNGYKNNDLQSLLQNDTIERVKMNDGECQSEQCINNYYTDIDTNINKEKDNKLSSKKAKEFVPPTVEEVKEYIKEKGYHFDAKSFVEYYESDDWHYGEGKKRRKVSNWKRCCTTWENTWKENHGGGDLFEQAEKNRREELLLKRFYEILGNEEAVIYGIDPNVWYTMDEKAKNYHRVQPQKKEKLLKWIREHDNG